MYGGASHGLAPSFSSTSGGLMFQRV